MATRTILLVDDDDDLRETLIEQLSLTKSSTFAESTAGKGIQMAVPTGRLLIMDVGLPTWTGARR